MVGSQTRDEHQFATKSFMAALDAQRGDASWRDVATQAGVSASTLTRLRQGATPDLGTFAKLCEWAGLDPANYLGMTDAEDADGQGNSLTQISALLRSDSSLNSEDVDVMEAIIKAAYLNFTKE